MINDNKIIEAIEAEVGDELFAAIRDHGGIIAGGAVLSVVTKKTINDIDVYWPSREAMADAIKQLTCPRPEVMYRGHTDKAVTFHDSGGGQMIQFINFDYFETPQDIFKAFDFTVCMAAVSLKDRKVIIADTFYEDVAARQLVFNPQTRFPYASLLRTYKYQNRGYTISPGGMLTIANACARKPITNWDEAFEQLGGVYGHDAILAEVDEESPFSSDKLDDILLRGDSAISSNSSRVKIDYQEMLNTFGITNPLGLLSSYVQFI